MERAIVFELNEVPPRVLDWWSKTTPSSPLAKLASSGTRSTTILDENLPRDLYPSQSWASVGMGAPWDDHQVFWYGDPKSQDHPFYWQQAATSGRSVGLVGVLHSSPVSTQCPGDQFRFVIPDVFSGNAETIPAALQPLQELNLRMTRQSARVASLSASPKDVLAAVDFARNGVRPATWARLGRLAAEVATGRANKERLRVGQALLMADVFVHQVRRHDTDLSVMFGNHVASAMHRYWAATFPEDWADNPYTSEWISANKAELPFAMEATDLIVGQLQRLADDTDRELIVLSSMGQKADLSVDPTQQEQAIIKDADALLARLDCPFSLTIRPAMVPQLSFELDDPTEVDEFVAWLRSALGDAAHDPMVSGPVVTIACNPTTVDGKVVINGEHFIAEAIGGTIQKIHDHRSGRHSTDGILLSNRRRDWPEVVDALDATGLILQNGESSNQLAA